MEGLEAGSVFGEDYRIARALYTGGFSTIYEVEQISTKARLALKVVHDSLGKDDKVRAAFLEEARRAAKIESEFAARVFSSGCDPETGLPFAAMELLEGTRLSVLVDKQGPLSPQEVSGFTAQLCHALSAAHAANVIHRDLKPEGIVVVAKPSGSLPYRVGVQFVGVAKIASDIRQNTTAAMSRGLWMAPEQAETNATVTPATDVWTVGLLAFWLLTGKSYWKTARDMGSAMVTLMREVLFDPIVPASKRAEELGVAAKIPAGFDAWFAKCVAREPQKRWGSAMEAANALAAVLGAAAPTFHRAQPPSVRPAPPEKATAARVEPSMTIPSKNAPLPTPTPPPASTPPPAGPALPTPSAPPPRSAPPPPVGSAPPPAPAPLPPSTPPPRVTGSAPPPAAKLSASAARKSRGRLLAILASLATVLVVGGYFGWDAWQASKRKDKREEAAREDRAREAQREAEREEAARKKKALEEWTDEEAPVPISYRDPMWGDRTAPVTIVVFSELECKVCATLDAALAVTEKEYGPQKLRVVWKHFPLPGHERGKVGAAMGNAVFRTAKGEAFFKFVRAAFLSGSRDLRDSELQGWAYDAGVKKLAEFDRAKEDAETTKKIEEDVALGKKLGVRSSPVIFINGLPMKGAITSDKLRPIIDEQLTKAKASKASPDKLYVALAKEQFAAVPEEKKRDNSKVAFKVPIAGSPVLGSADALVTVVSFADFECDHCATAHKTLEALKAKYGERLRIVWKDRPLSNHPRARAAANFAREVRDQKGDEAFFKAVSLLFEHQTALTDKDLKGYAKSLEANPGKTLSAVTDSKYESIIAVDEALADTLEVTGTPHFFINGRKVAGAISESDFTKLIDEAETDAKARLARGVAASGVYDDIMSTARADTIDLRTIAPGSPSYTSPKIGYTFSRVHVQIFCDHETPECKTMVPIVAKLVEKNPDNVFVVWRYLPQADHALARDVANAASEVHAQLGDAGFWKFTEAWFAKLEEKHDTLRPELKQIAIDVAKELGLPLDTLAFDLAIDQKKHDWRVKVDEERAEELSITELPTIVVGKYAFAGTASAAKLQSLVDRVLKEP